ncbi:hypothetical protein AGRA3207_006074 [Actinomadura graeca]|uniref:Uncharacterized protein n=1 Tax=Actinomadura graeca TaxID=2750812 RepID=A0ABX8R404_9ACTN|nr:hypothetical protein [Actinomadura graeca]QXJ24697.1 hypothetical protein AGRA3207_006074 [Actinomadura graeca]
MDLLIVPALTDFTTEVVAPPGTEVLDLNARMTARLADPVRLRAQEQRLDPTEALFARAAAALLERGGGTAGHLRAIGFALRLARDPAVRLTLDDLELTGGTTQSSRDVLGAAARCRVFGPELEEAEAAARGRRAWILVDADQALPAAFALVRRLGPGGAALCGGFVARHAGALRRVPDLAEVELRGWSPCRVVRGAGAAGEHPPGRLRGAWGAVPPPESGPVPRRTVWVTGGGRPGRSGPWAGWLDAERAAALPRETLGRCRGLTVTVTGYASMAVATATDGTLVDLRPVLDALPPSAPLSFELVVGAPGMDESVVDQSVRALTGGGAHRLAGLRPYRMPCGSGWAGELLCLGPDPEHDLARWTRFEAPRTLPPETARALVAAWLDRLAPRADLYPGRLAASTVLGPVPSSPRGGLRWDDSAEVVTGPDGAHVVNLRWGRAFRLNPRLVPLVRRLAAREEGVLDALSGASRDRLVTHLEKAGVVGRRP